jgi:mannose-6-phosphate isomerase-like protein (cupin superfamily)
MAEYTVVNLKEVEDAAPRFGFAPNMEARFATRPLGLEQSGLSYQRIAPNFRQPFKHSHKRQEEVYVLMTGSAKAILDDESVELSAWDALRLPPETSRFLEAGPEGAELLMFGAPSVGENPTDDVEASPSA